MPARFFQTATLVLQLGKAKRDGSLDRLMADIGRVEMFALDEFGYVPFDVDDARLLYQAISDSCERRGIVFSTNVEFSRWDTVFADDKLAAAIVDRVVYHGRLIEFGVRATSSRSPSCWASQEYRGAPVSDPENLSWRNPKESALLRKRGLTKHIRGRLRGSAARRRGRPGAGRRREERSTAALAR